MPRTHSILVVTITSALIGAGCGANAPTPSDTSDGGASTPRSQAVRFAQCMRTHGVKAFPDPDASGELTLDGVVNGSSLDPEGPAWKRASAACRDLEPSGFTGRARTAQQQDDALAFARCMREHGVKDFPDPTKDSPLVDTNRIPSSATEGGMAILNAAMRTCGDVYAGRLGLKGRR